MHPDQKAKLDPAIVNRPAWRAGGGPTVPGGPGSPEGGVKSRYNNSSVRAKVDTGLSKPSQPTQGPGEAHGHIAVDFEKLLSSCREKCELSDLSDLLDPEKNKEFEYVFVTDTDGKQHVVNKHDLIKQLHQAKNGGGMLGSYVSHPPQPMTVPTILSEPPVASSVTIS